MGETQGAYIDATLIEHAQASIVIDLLALSWHMNKSIDILRDYNCMFWVIAVTVVAMWVNDTIRSSVPGCSKPAAILDNSSM